MKVLQINSVCGIRSTGRICTDIAKILEQNGHECKIAYGRETVPENCKKYAYRIGTNTETKINALKARFFDNDGFGIENSTKQFIKWIDEYDPNIIHLHNLHGYYLNIRVLFNYLKSSKKPVIWTLHDCWSFTGHCAYFSYAGCDKWKNGGCGKCPLKKSYPSSWLFDNSTNNLKLKRKLISSLDNLTVVTPSKWLSDLVKCSFLNEFPVRIIHNGIDIDTFKPTVSDFKSNYGIETKKIILGVASVWSQRKGFDDFLNLSKMINDDYRIVLVGLNKAQIKKLPNNIIGITKTDSAKQLAEIYTVADVFFNPTYEDNYPTVNLEAQACGTPVITYKTGGSIESVPEENVVKQGDLMKVLDMLNCKKLSILPVSDFDKNKFFREYLELYEKLEK